MAFIFLDTSALIKLYLPEVGSAWLQNYTAGNQIVVSELVLFECTTVLRRRYIEAAFTREVAQALLARVISDCRTYQVVPLGGELQLNQLSELVFNLSPALRIRALDGLHLVAAQIALESANSLTPPESLVFVSADIQLLNAAQTLGFVTENPENYA